MTGRVLNPDGSPAGAADVWAVYEQHGRRTFIYTLHTKTEAGGTYHFSGILLRSGMELKWGTNVTVLATRTGSAPAITYVMVDKTEVSAPDVSFSRDQASLTVSVQNPDGSPAVGVPVEVRADMFASITNPFGFHQTEAAKKLRQLLVPQQVTASDGTVRFTHLHPDRYRLNTWQAALTDPNRPLPRVLGEIVPPLPRNVPSATALEVPVTVGEEARHSLRLLPLPAPVHLRFLLPDGNIIKEKSFDYGIVEAFEEELRWGSSYRSGGEARDYLELPVNAGVWHITTAVRPEPPYAPIRDAPKLVGQVSLAASPRNATPRTIDVHLKRREATRLKVHIMDEAGKPVVGVAYTSGSVDLFRQRGTFAGESDTQGNLLIALSSDKPPTLWAAIPGDAPLPDVTTLNTVKGPFPSDALLINLRRWPATRVDFEPGEETTIRLKAARVGWVRGKIIGASKGYFDLPTGIDSQWGTIARYDTQTGEYLIGPLPPGSVLLDFQGEVGGKQETVTVKPGQVLYHDITVDPARTNPSKRWEEQATRLSQTPITVVDAEGKPVAGAHVFVRGLFYKIGLTRVTDDTGVAHAAPISGQFPELLRRRTMGTENLPQSGLPRWVAFVPGANGAGMTAPIVTGAEQQPQRIVLPPKISLTGKVMVGGKALQETPGTVMVYARCEDYEELTPYLSLLVTPSADGTFRLQGLTPGRYTVQAALDNTYFSDVQTLTVAPGIVTKPLTFNIAAPGKPVMLDLGAGGALKRVFPLTKPVGPLAELQATRYWVADGAGIVRLEGLPAGKQRVHLPDGTTRGIVVVPEK